MVVPPTAWRPMQRQIAVVGCLGDYRVTVGREQALSRCPGGVWRCQSACKGLIRWMPHILSVSSRKFSPVVFRFQQRDALLSGWSRLIAPGVVALSTHIRSQHSSGYSTRAAVSFGFASRHPSGKSHALLTGRYKIRIKSIALGVGGFVLQHFEVSCVTSTECASTSLFHLAACSDRAVEQIVFLKSGCEWRL